MVLSVRHPGQSNRHRRARCIHAYLVLLVPLLFAVAARGAGPTELQEWESRTQELLKDPSLIRLYTFQEQQGLFAVDQVAKGEASIYGKHTMLLLSNSPYGQPRSKYESQLPPQIYPEWTEGRWPGKGAVTSGYPKQSLMRSGFYDTKSGSWTVAAWFRIHLRDLTRDSTSLIYCGSAYTDGWSLTWNSSNAAAGGNIEFRVGRAGGPITVNAGSVPAGSWHFVVASYSPQSIQISVDGQAPETRANDKPIVIKPNPFGTVGYNDYGSGMCVGRDASRDSDNRFDLDELIVFDRVLAAADAARLYEQGKPKASLEAQVARYWQIQARQAELARIQLTIPIDRYGYFFRGDPFLATATVPYDTPFRGDFSARFALTNLAGDTLFDQTLPMPQVGDDFTAKLGIAPGICTLYWLDMEVRDGDGQVLKRYTWPFAIIPPLPPNSQTPADAPLACHHMTVLKEHEVLGAKVDRIIRGWAWMEREEGKYTFEYEDKSVNRARELGMDMMFCVDLRPPAWLGLKEGSRNLPKDMGKLETFIREMVGHFKGRVAYWEIFNEPNSGHGLQGKDRATDYVEYLKLAYRVIHEVDPNAKVVGFSGVHRFRWFQEVMNAGAAPYFDICTLHNYGFPPIPLNRERRLVQNVRELLDSYGREDAPVWNGECGYDIPARVNGRPISLDTLYAKYADSIREAYGARIAPASAPMTSEHRGACWQAQSILMELAIGAKRYFMLMGSSHYSPIFNADDGCPSETGIAYATLATILNPSRKIEELPLNASDQFATLVTGRDGSHTAAFFANAPGRIFLDVGRMKQIQGLDFLGNPLAFTPRDGLLQLDIGEAPIYLLDVPSDIEERPIITVYKAPAEMPQDNRLDGTLRLSNPFDEPLRARLTATVPEGASIELADSVDIAPGKRIKLPFTVDAGTMRKGPQRVVFTLETDDGPIARTDHSFNCSGTIHPIHRVKDAIPLDGTLEPWADIAPEVARTEANVVAGKPMEGVPGVAQWRGENDLSFQLRTAWRPDDGLYVLLEVTDNTLMPAPEGKHVFQYDSLEFFLDLRPPDARQSSYGNGVQQLVVRPVDADATDPCRVDIYPNTVIQTVDAEFVGRRTPTGYLLEGRITPRAAAAFKLAAGSRLCLDANINDTDSDKALRKVIMAMHSDHSSSANNTSGWGSYELAP